MSVEGEPGETRSFPQTRWSLVGRAADHPGDAAAARQALAELLARYLPAMRAHLLARRRVRPDEVDDLLQAFVTGKVLEQNLLRSAEPSRGRFRAFLVTALDNYVANAHRDRSRAKRSPAGGPPQSLADTPEPPASAEATVDPFDLVWAQEVIREALRRTQADCETAGRGDLWALFHARVAAPLLDGAEPVPYERLVQQLKFESPAQATNALVTAKRTFARVLRGVVAEYAGGGAGATGDRAAQDAVDEEIRDLRAILQRARV